MLRYHALGVKGEDIGYWDRRGITAARLRRRGVFGVEETLKRLLSSVTVCTAALCALLKFAIDDEPGCGVRGATGFVPTFGTEPEMWSGGGTRHNSLMRPIAASVV